jgi:DNA-binding HxlR family transcriptional regulator
MSAGLPDLPDIEVADTEREDACVEGASTADVLRLLSAGATGAILMALGDGPLRTMELTDRVPGYSSRTIYRYAGKLAELDVVSREEEPGVPSKVVYTLTDECGAELYQLVNRFADASLTRLPDGRIDAGAWASLGLLADLWETGMVEDLACEGRSATQLAQGEHGLSYHQVQRRAGMFKGAGLLSLAPGEGNRRCYELTDKTRRKMSLVAGIARWRNRHVLAEDEEGMTAPEMATVLRTALPLASVPAHSGCCLQLSVRSEDDAPGAEHEEVWAEIRPSGRIQSCVEPSSDPHAWGRGKVGSWIPALLDGDSTAVSVGGEESLVSDCLDSLHETLWSPALF